jgi:hypothetical protein
LEAGDPADHEELVNGGHLPLETVLYERLPIVKGAAKAPMQSVKNCSYTVCRDDGEKFEFNGNSVRSVRKLGDSIRDEVHKRNVPWRVVEERS